MTERIGVDERLTVHHGGEAAMRHRIGVVVALAMIVLGAAGCAGTGGGGGGSGRVGAVPAPGCASGSVEPGVSLPAGPRSMDARMWALQDRLDHVADRVEAVGGRFTDSYAGVTLELAYARVAVYRVPSAAFDAAIARELPGEPVRLVDAAHSARDLDALADRINADRGYWQAHEVPLNMVGALHDGSCVQVGTHDPDSARALFSQRYGRNAPIRLVRMEPVRPVLVTGVAGRAGR